MTLWGSWLVTLVLVFSISSTVNSYYLAALAPPIAGLLGTGASLAWKRRQSSRTKVAVIGVVLLTGGYGLWLLPSSGTGLPTWLAPVFVSLNLLAIGAVLTKLLLHDQSTPPRMVTTTVGVVSGALLLLPLVASVSVVSNGLGAFDTPFQPTAVTAFTRAFFGAPLKPLSTLPAIEAARQGAPDLMAAQTSVLAAPLIFATGQEVLPIGGYTGTIPEPSVSELRSMVAAGTFHLVVTAATSFDSRVIWVAENCLKLATPPNSANDLAGALATYYCAPRP